MRAFKIHSVQSDGSSTPVTAVLEYYVTDPQTGKPFRDDDGRPSVVVTCRPISKTKHRQIQQLHTSKVVNPKTRAMDEVVDWEAVQDDLIDYCILSWSGLIGSDDKPLVCIRETKIQLPGELANDIVKHATVGEGVTASAESFRATA